MVRMPRPPSVHVGERYGRLSVVRDLGTRLEGSSYRRVYLCRCDCGAEFEAVGKRLRTGQTKSCGCLQRESFDQFGERNAKRERTHGHTTHGHRSRTYRSWESMRRRCLSATAVDYPRYGGRGITVCAEWASFEQFLADMGERPERMSLDRIDADGNYEPANCRWADAKTQRRNRSRTAKVR